MDQFPDRNLLDCLTLEHFPRKLSASRSLYALRSDTDTGRCRRILAVKEAVLRTVKDSPSTGSKAVRRSAVGAHLLFASPYIICNVGKRQALYKYNNACC